MAVFSLAFVTQLPVNIGCWWDSAHGRVVGGEWGESKTDCVGINRAISGICSIPNTGPKPQEASQSWSRSEKSHHDLYRVKEDAPRLNYPILLILLTWFPYDVFSIQHCKFWKLKKGKTRTFLSRASVSSQSTCFVYRNTLIQSLESPGRTLKDPCQKPVEQLLISLLRQYCVHWNNGLISYITFCQVTHCTTAVLTSCFLHSSGYTISCGDQVLWFIFLQRWS